MYMKRVLRVSFLLLGIFSFSIHSLAAVQSPDGNIANLYSGSGTAPQGSEKLESCFDYYTFGSLPLQLTTDSLQLAQGGVLNIKGFIENKNSYPVDDVTVYAKVFYRKDLLKTPYGPDVVDMFVISDKLTLKAGESLSLNSKWIVPSNAEPGSYQIAGYVTSHNRFNMSGLTFTNDIVGTLLDFSVVGLRNDGAVRFDVTHAAVAGHPTYGAAFPPTIPSSASSTYPATVGVQNTTSDNFSGKVNWSAYYWDADRGDQLISHSSSEVSLNAHASTTLSYTVTDSNHTVYYVVAELVSSRPHDAKSYIGFRYSLAKPSPEPRLAYVGTTGYPGTSQGKAFACFNSTSNSLAANTRVELSAHDLDILGLIPWFGNLGSKVYTGDIPGDVSAISLPLKHSSGDFSVTASLYQNGKVIDTVTSTYSCKVLGGNCIDWAPLIAIFVVLAVFILIVVLGIRYMNKRRSSNLPL
jgi:hypothetical protein